VAANYNNSAWYYDSLSRLVYGRALIKAQIYYLKLIPQRSTILIVGGGTGWILEEITALIPAGLKITYVEVAAKMMALSKKRSTGNNDVLFINAAIENSYLTEKFDVIITPFLLDNFTNKNLHIVFDNVYNLLGPDGIWLNISFRNTKNWWQQVLLTIMFLFF